MCGVMYPVKVCRKAKSAVQPQRPPEMYNALTNLERPNYGKTCRLSRTSPAANLVDAWPSVH
jgi:hypothetical protein